MPDPYRGRRSWSAAAAALCAALSLVVAAPSVTAADQPRQTAHAAHRRRPPANADQLSVRLTHAVSVQRVTKHLRALQRIADRAGGTRTPGTAGFDGSLAYVRQQLERAGYDVVEQPFEFNFTQVLAERMTQLEPAPGGPIPVRVINYTPPTPDGGLEADLEAVPVDADGSTGCELADYGDRVVGKIALIKRGVCSFTQKQAVAAEAGAVAALIYNNVDGSLFGTLLEPDDGVIPVGALTLQVGEQLAALDATQNVRLRLELRQFLERRVTSNLIADTAAGDPNNVVVLGAHLDSAPEGPGINDNGSGSATILELAIQLAKSRAAHPNKIRFAWWSAEEWGQLGSETYLASLSDTDRAAIRQYLDFSKLGSFNYARYVLDGSDRDGTGGPVGPEGSAEIERVFTDWFASRGLPSSLHDLDGPAQADWLPFFFNDIPVGGLFSGSEGLKTEEEARIYGGTAGVPHDECLNLACDRLGHINFTILDQNADAAAHALSVFAFAEQAEGQAGGTAGATRAGGAAATARAVHR